MRVMRVALHDGRVVLGRVEDGAVVPVLAEEEQGPDVLVRALDAGIDLARARPCAAPVAISEVRPLAPLQRPRKIVAIGLNYLEHARETNSPVPERPLVFAKFPSSIIDPGEPIRFRMADTTQVDWEAELGVVISRRCRDVSARDAPTHVLGYCNLNDVSARDAQLGDGQWVRGKSFDGFCPMGPMLVGPEEIADPQRLRIMCRVNGITMQSSTTVDMIFSVAELIVYLSRFMTLEPGDVIATGTPFGVGMSRTPPVWLADGDVVEVEVEGLGILRNPVVAS